MSTTHTEQPHVPPPELVPLFRRLPQQGEVWRASDGLMGDVHIEACPVAPLLPPLLLPADTIGDRLVHFTQGRVQYAMPIKDFMAFIPWTTVGASGQGPRTYYAPRFYCVSGPHDERQGLALSALHQRLARISDLSGSTVEGWAMASELLLTLGRIARGEL